MQSKTRRSHHPHKFSLFKQVSNRTWILIGLVVLFSVSTAYAAPKINDYLAVNAAISNAKQSQSKGDYADALASLNSVEGRWTFQSAKQELESLKAQEGTYIQDQSNFDVAVSKENSGDLNGAQQLLQSIAGDFPQISEVQSELTSVQSKIESQLQSQTLQAQDQARAAQAEKAKADAQAAQASAEAAQAAKDKADAQATAAAAAQAQAEANAQAVAEAAAAQQAAANAAHQVRVSFYNQLLSISQAVNSNGISYYNQAIDYYNTSQNLVALAEFGQAQAIFQKAYTDASTLSSGFTGLTNDYLTASENMTAAANYCLQATNFMINGIGDQVDNTSIANSDMSYCSSYKASVNLFLNDTTP